jgi:hypothetical protein
VLAVTPVLRFCAPAWMSVPLPIAVRCTFSIIREWRAGCLYRALHHSTLSPGRPMGGPDEAVCVVVASITPTAR